MSFKIQTLYKKLDALSLMKKAPKEIFYIGNKELLERKKVSIVGTRRPSQYTKEYTFTLARELAKRGVVVVSGAAMGVDAIAHKAAGAKNTIAVMANGLDIKYPAVNKKLIEEIYKEGLALSFFQEGFRATKWSFVIRNELVVALGDILIVTEADLQSGSLRSVEYALKMKKDIYVLPHRLNESLGTNSLLAKNQAKAIYDLESFLNQFGTIKKSEDEFLNYIQSHPILEEALEKFQERVYEAELEGIIIIENGRVKPL
jgi:DNA processing protein